MHCAAGGRGVPLSDFQRFGQGCACRLRSAGCFLIENRSYRADASALLSAVWKY